MNTRAIGNAAELEAKKMLQSQGFVAYKGIKTRFFTDDIFGLFDVIAINEREVKLVQVKAGAIWPETRIAIANFKVPANVSKEIWLRKKHQPKNDFKKRWHVEIL